MPHKIGVVCEGRLIEGWITYSIQVSMIKAAGSFTLSRPFSETAWLALRRDAKLTILIDGTKYFTGIVDDRTKNAKTNTLTVAGASIYGRLMKESAPSASYENLKLLDVVKRLASPHIPSVITSDAANRTLRRGKGGKVVSGTEPLIIDLPTPKRGRVHPGTPRATIIEDLTGQAGYLVMEAADGNSLIVLKPNYKQAAQFLICNARPASSNRTTCKDLEIKESNGDRYSLIAVVGTGAGDDANYGANVKRSGRAVDFDSPDGTGRDFIRPKRMLMPEKDFDRNQDAKRAADRDMARRNFHRTSIVATMPNHGQLIAGSTVPTLYAPNTIARVIDEDFDPPFDDTYLIHTLALDGARQEQTTRLEMVPTGTEIVP
jgi:prophage tail gpP-like protein